MKKALITALSLLAIGGICFAGGFIASGCDLSQVGGRTRETHTITESVQTISFDVAAGDVRVVKATDGVCKVVCEESEKLYHSVSVENGNLTVKLQDDRAWYDHVGFSFFELEATLYLPETDYQNISVSTASGDIEIGDGFTFANMSLESMSGEIEVGQVRVENLNARAVSGAIDLEGVAANKDISLKCTSGGIEVADVSCGNLSVDVTSGRVELENTITTQKTEIRTVSGGVRIENSDGAEYLIKTSSGGVRASFRTSKVFSCKTSSGSVNAPHSTVGGACVVETSSGNIRLSILG